MAMSTNSSPDKKITMICPNLSCRRTLTAPAKTRGQVIRCAFCRVPFRVPDAPVRDAEASAASNSSGDK
jgi:hypothetical protein